MSAENSDAIFEATYAGSIIEDIIDKKYEKTDIYEDPDTLYYYQRNVLRDTGPDNRNTFAEDEPRQGGLGYRSGVINVRENGKRSLVDPKHTEIFTELTGKDPRGNSNLPNMSQMAEQSRHRGKNFELSFKDDSDNSILESARNPGQVSSDIKDAMQRSKQMLQIFDDSEIGWTGGNPMITTKKSLKEKVLEDTHQIDINDHNIQHRRSNVTELSNKAPIGWHTQNDQKIKISRYQKIYSGNGKAVDTRYAQNKQEQDMKIVKYRDNYVPSNVYDLINKYTKSRTLYQETLPPSNRFWGKVKENYVRTNSGNGENVSRMSGEKGKESISQKLNNTKTEIKNQLRKINTSTFISHDKDITELSKMFVKSLETTNKQGKPDEKDINKIQRYVINNQRKNKQIGSIGNSNKEYIDNTFKGHVKGTSILNNKFGKDMQVHNYKSTNNMIDNSKLKSNQKLDHETNELYDDQSQVRTISKFQNDLIMDKNDTFNDMSFNDSGVKTRHGGVIGTKYVTREHKTDHETNDINDK